MKPDNRLLEEIRHLPGIQAAIEHARSAERQARTAERVRLLSEVEELERALDASQTRLEAARAAYHTARDQARQAIDEAARHLHEADQQAAVLSSRLSDASTRLNRDYGEGELETMLYRMHLEIERLEQCAEAAESKAEARKPEMPFFHVFSPAQRREILARAAGYRERIEALQGHVTTLEKMRRAQVSPDEILSVVEAAESCLVSDSGDSSRLAS